MKNIIALIILIAATFAFAVNEAVKPEGEGTAESPYVLTKIENLVWMNNNMRTCQSSFFCLGNDIDASETAGWETQFVPIGTAKTSTGKSYNFQGVLDGKNFAIKNLHSRNSGLILHLDGAVIKNLHLENVNLGRRYAGINKSGGLTPECSNSVITNVHVSGKIKGTYEVGGICGEVEGSQIVNCSFVGFINVFGDASGEYSYGGIAGYASYSDLSYCKASGYINCVDGFARVGGICGFVYGMDNYDKYIPRVRYCIADMKITAEGNIGGIVGQNFIENIVRYPGSPSYVATEMGLLDNYSLSVAYTSPENTVGGICATFSENTTTSSENYYDKTGINGTVVGKGLSPENMKKRSSYTKWDFNKVWTINEGESTPYWKLSNDKPYRIAYVSNFLGTLGVEPEEKSYAFKENITINVTTPKNVTFFGIQGDIETTETSISVTLQKDLAIEGEFARYIKTAGEFLKIGKDKDYPAGGHYIQSVNINMPEIDDPTLGSFWGVYDGNNRVIRDVKFNTKSSTAIGLFGSVSEAKISNLGILEAENNSGSRYFGFLGGDVNYSEISNCYVYTDMNLAGANNAGGLFNIFEKSRMIRCEFKGNIYSADVWFGGLVSQAKKSSFEECSVEMFTQSGVIKSKIAGLVFSAYETDFVNCYAKGDCFNYALVAPSPNQELSFSNCYVFAENNCSLPNSTFLNCYFNSNCVAAVEGVTGFVSEEEMKKQETYVGWDFDEIWDIEEGVGTPYFRYAVPEPVGTFLLLLLPWLLVKRHSN
ncbi:hypothetical protein IKW72_04340 [bacterium]|nr:hypothetical protein [bacterium]